MGRQSFNTDRNCRRCGRPFRITSANQRHCDLCMRRRTSPGDCTECGRDAEVASIGTAHLCLNCLLEVHLTMLAEQRLYRV